MAAGESYDSDQPMAASRRPKSLTHSLGLLLPCRVTLGLAILL